MVTWLFPVLPVFLVDAGPWRVDAVAMSKELQITSFCARSGSRALQRLPQVRRLISQHHDHLVEVPVGGDPRDTVVTGQRIRGGPIAEPPQAPAPPARKQVSARLLRGVPHRRRSAASSRETKQASSLGTSSVAR